VKAAAEDERRALAIKEIAELRDGQGRC